MEQKDCDNATIMASWSMALWRRLLRGECEARVKAMAMFENPPPSHQENHISAWDLPEMASFLTLDIVNFAMFNMSLISRRFRWPIGARTSNPTSLRGRCWG